MAEQNLKLNIPEMTSNHCVESIIRAINTVPGVISAESSASTKSAEIRNDDTQANVDDFIGAIDHEGYGATPT